LHVATTNNGSGLRDRETLRDFGQEHRPPQPLGFDGRHHHFGEAIFRIKLFFAANRKHGLFHEAQGHQNGRGESVRLSF